MKINLIILISCIVLLSSCSSQKKAPDNFGFIFKTDWVAFNSFNKTVKTRVRDEKYKYRDTTISLELSKNQMDSVYTIMEEIQISTYPERYVPDDIVIPMSPNILHSFDFYYVYGNQKKRVVWEENTHSELEKSNQLSKLFQTIIDMIWNHPEYKKLPHYIEVYM